jgi:carbonic anhydrase
MRAVPAAGRLPLHLIAGYERFRNDRYRAEQVRYRELAEIGQQPPTLVVACSDSRAAPEAVFDARPGELFVVRNVAGLVPVFAPDGTAHGVSAALEYGVLALGVTSIVVLGHGRCGGIGAALDDVTPLTTTDFLGAWVADLRALGSDRLVAATADPDSRRLTLERLSIERSVERLRSFPWIRSREGSGEVALCGAWFDIALGELHALGPRGWQRVPA